MTAIEPGELFTIEYGKGHKLEVVALNGRQRLKCIRFLAQAQSAGSDFAALCQATEELFECVKLCAPSLTEEQLEKMDDELMAQVIVKTLGKAAISEDEAKKSE